MSQFRITLEACVAGNPFKAWREKLPAGETRDDEFAPDRMPPDDVWEAQVHEFDDLNAAKDFIRGLPEQTTTHVMLEVQSYSGPDEAPTFDGWVPIYVQDAGAEHLDAAAPDVTPPHLVDSPLPFDDDDTIEDAPPLVPSQGAAQ